MSAIETCALLASNIDFAGLVLNPPSKPTPSEAPGSEVPACNSSEAPDSEVEINFADDDIMGDVNPLKFKRDFDEVQGKTKKTKGGLPEVGGKETLEPLLHNHQPWDYPPSGSGQQAKFAKVPAAEKPQLFSNKPPVAALNIPPTMQPPQQPIFPPPDTQKFSSFFQPSQQLAMGPPAATLKSPDTKQSAQPPPANEKASLIQPSQPLTMGHLDKKKLAQPPQAELQPNAPPTNTMKRQPAKKPAPSPAAMQPATRRSNVSPMTTRKSEPAKKPASSPATMQPALRRSKGVPDKQPPRDRSPMQSPRPKHSPPGQAPRKLSSLQAAARRVRFDVGAQQTALDPPEAKKDAPDDSFNFLGLQEDIDLPPVPPTPLGQDLSAQESNDLSVLEYDLPEPDDEDL